MNELPAQGDGLAYVLALNCLRERRGRSDEWSTTIPGAGAVLDALEAVLQRELGRAIGHDERGAENYLAAARRLNSVFDIDNVVGFSGAWPLWRDAARVLRAEIMPSPLDQDLFNGCVPESPGYFEGIRRLAERNSAEVIEGLRSRGYTWLGETGLDVGAGPLPYLGCLADLGMISNVIAVDLDFAARHAVSARAGIRWVTQDARHLHLERSLSTDVLWVGNLLHHYSPAENLAILRHAAPYLSSNGLIVIHDYPLRLAGKTQLYAAILGFHFLLTTGGSRTFTEAEITALVHRAIPDTAHVESIPLRASALLIYRRAAGG